jgi:hypothetical protein
VEGARRLALVFGLVALFTACGSAHRSTYSGRIYSVAEVRRAFAAVGLQLHRDSTPSPGVVELVNNRRLGPELLPAPRGFLRVFVATRPTAVGSWAPPSNWRVWSHANVSAYSWEKDSGGIGGAIYALRWGTGPQLIGPVHLGESRRAVERALGPGDETRRGVATYFGGHLVVDYSWHDQLFNAVQWIQTSSRRFHTRSGVHVGSSRRDLRARGVRCGNVCTVELGPWPDALGMGFHLRHGKVVSIEIGSA